MRKRFWPNAILECFCKQYYPYKHRLRTPSAGAYFFKRVLFYWKKIHENIALWVGLLRKFIQYKFTNISNNKTLPTILSFTFVMIFETYIFEYFKVRVVDSHYPGLFMCIFSLRIAVPTAAEHVVYKHFLSISESRNMEYCKQTHNCNIEKQEGKKI